ncbi:MAG: SWIM zinc finger family protein [Ktedonobacteraceae bacterium]
MSRRWRGGYNDFEWDYYSEHKPRKVEGGIKAKSERGAIGETWWSQRWVEVLESFGMGTRLTRGRSYARKGQVLSIEIESGLVKAKVQGSMQQPYAIKIRLQPLSKRDWEQVTTAMASQAIFAAKLLAGEMPKNIEEAFDSVNLSLFPETEDDLQTSCSCPDWANPCKHIAAVYYILAERFDDDPFLLFKLRGRDKEAIIAALREKRVEKLEPKSKGEKASADKPEKREEAMQDEVLVRLEDQLNTFWLAGEALDTFAVNVSSPDVDNAILKRLGDAPFVAEGKNVAQVLEKAYDGVHAAALRKTAE